MKNRLIVIGAVLLIVGIPALAWLLGMEPQLRQAGLANADREQAQIVNAAHEAKLVELQKLNDRMDELEVELADLAAMIPGDDAVSTLLGQLNELAEEAGVAIQSITAEVPKIFAAEKDPSAPAAPASGETATTTQEVTNSATTVGDAGMIAIPIEIRVLGERDATLKFTALAQAGTRLYLVTDAEISTAPDDGTTTTLKGFVFVLPDARAALEINE